MINVGTLSKLRRLVRRDGISQREAARRLGISRNTVTKWLEHEEMKEPRYPKRATAASILDPYKEQLSNWLKADSYRSKRERRDIKSMFHAIRAIGYGGSRGPVYEYCKKWREEQPRLMPCPNPFDGYVEQPVRVSATALIHYQRNRYSVPCEWINTVVSLRAYPEHLLIVAPDGGSVTLKRCFERDQTLYDWMHYISLVERKPGALRNGAPFRTMPEPLQELQRQLLKYPGGDRVMAQVLSAVILHGLEAVLVAVELALQSGRVSAEHVLNILSRLKEQHSGMEAVRTELQLVEPPQADVQRYDHLRVAPEGEMEADHVQ